MLKNPYDSAPWLRNSPLLTIDTPGLEDLALQQQHIANAIKPHVSVMIKQIGLSMTAFQETIGPAIDAYAEIGRQLAYAIADMSAARIEVLANPQLLADILDDAVVAAQEAQQRWEEAQAAEPVELEVSAASNDVATDTMIQWTLGLPIEARIEFAFGMFFITTALILLAGYNPSATTGLPYALLMAGAGSLKAFTISVAKHHKGKSDEE